jgi:Zn-finger nucleic acid-binding protein
VPYREGAAPTCPRCGATLLFERETFTCSRACGEWIENDWLRNQKVEGDLGLLDRRATSHTFCPVCRRRLEIRVLEGATFESCPSHGVWLESDRRQPFHQRLSALLQSERAVRELAAQLETAHGRREVARRILALEAQLERLGKKLDDRE